MSAGMLRLVLVAILAGCGGSTTPPTGGTPSPTTSSGIRQSFDAPTDLTPSAFGAYEDGLIADALRSSGAGALLGGSGQAVLDQRRHEVLTALAQKASGAGDSRVASIGPPLPPGPINLALADLVGGNLLTMTSLISELIKVRDPTELDRSGQSQVNETKDVVVDGKPATVSVQAQLTLTASGSRLQGSASLQLAATFKGLDGAVMGSVSMASTGTVDIDLCPAADGSVTGSFDLSITADTRGPDGAATGTTTFHTKGKVAGQVGEDAYLHGYTIDSAAQAATSGAGVTATNRSVTVSAGYVVGSGGDTGSISLSGDPSGSVVEADPSATDPDITALYKSALSPGIFIGTLLFSAAQSRWRDGACVRVDATEHTRDVSPSELVHFTAKPVQRIEGIDLKKPVVLTFTGEKSAAPVGQEQDPPASVSFTAAADPGKQGVVSLTSTSNRGIGTLALTFTVVRPVALELEIDSAVTPTRLSGFSVPLGEASARGRIPLNRDGGTGPWSGAGTLSSATSTGSGGCPVIHITGEGSYDWVVRSAIAGPEVTNAADLSLDMDAGPKTEQPDEFTADTCQTTLTGTMNTWENLFFTVYRDRYGPKGLHVDGWTLVATPDTWKTGGLVATAHWSGSCAQNLSAIETKSIACTDATTFKLWAVVR
jgi:hypothetical protein